MSICSALPTRCATSLRAETIDQISGRLLGQFDVILAWLALAPWMQGIAPIGIDSCARVSIRLHPRRTTMYDTLQRRRLWTSASAARIADVDVRLASPRRSENCLATRRECALSVRHGFIHRATLPGLVPSVLLAPAADTKHPCIDLIGWRALPCATARLGGPACAQASTY
jgi:hypothetical protein